MDTATPSYFSRFRGRRFTRAYYADATLYFRLPIEAGM